VAEQFNCISAITRPIRENRYDRSFSVVAERLIDLVTNREFGSHGESSAHEALRPVRFKYGFFEIGKMVQVTKLISPHDRRSP
jgi:hypothetical protein